CKIGLGFDSDKASTSGTKTMSFDGSFTEMGTNESTLPGSKVNNRRTKAVALEEEDSGGDGAGNSFVYDPNVNSFNDPINFFNHPPHPQTYLCELCENDSYYGYDCPPRVPLVYEQEPCYNQNFGDNYYPQNSQSFPQQYICCENCGGPHYGFDCQTDESTIPLNEIITQIPPSNAITPVLPTMEPEDSLIMGDKDLRTIPEKESDKFIKSIIEDLIPIPRESKDTSDSDKECDFPFCYNFVTFFNPIFDANNDFTSSNEGVLKESVKIYLNPLFDFDDKYISSDVNPLFSEVLEDIESEDSYVSNLDEPALFVTPLFNDNKDECFDPGGDIDEIDADVSMDIEDGYHDSKGDIIYFESLLINDTILNLPPEVFLDHDLRILKDEPDNDDLNSMVKVFDPGIHEKIISSTYVRLPFEDRHYLSLTFVTKIFLHFLTYLVNSHLLLSFESEDTIFDPGISTYSFYSLEPVAMKF
nr:hypothetical protein [Tanacetum cinerariifolium]